MQKNENLRSSIVLDLKARLYISHSKFSSLADIQELIQNYQRNSTRCHGDKQKHRTSLANQISQAPNLRGNSAVVKSIEYHDHNTYRAQIAHIINWIYHLKTRSIGNRPN